jgi:hypothetical protein
MATLNLRNIPEYLARELRVEAAAAGVGVKEYCLEIFSRRKDIPIQLGPKKKIASVSGEAGAEGGGTPDLPRLGKTVCPGCGTLDGRHQGWCAETDRTAGEYADARLESFREAGARREENNAPLVYKARGITDVNLGLGSICQLPEKIPPANPEGDWVGGNRDIDPFNKEDVAAFQERDRQAAAGLSKTPRGEEPNFIAMPKWSEARLREMAEAEPGGLMACSPELLAEMKEAAKTDSGVATTLHMAGVELDREILVRWGLAENYKPKTEDKDGDGKATRKGRRTLGRSVTSDQKSIDGPQTNSVGTGEPQGTRNQQVMDKLRNICAGNISDAVGEPLTKEMVDAPDFGEVDLCGFKSYNDVDGENYICGLEKHGPKVKHGDWIKV